MMESKLKFGQFITQKRKEQQLTQKEFAAKLFVTESAVSKWERGVSYPDISLVTEICQILKVTEHELITSSEDYRQRKLEKQAKTFSNIVKTYSRMLYLGYGISLLACFIVNLAVSHTLSWFFIVLTAEMAAFSLLNLPVILEKKKGMATMFGSYLTINLLLFTCCIYTGGSWMMIPFVSITCGYIVLFLPFILREVLKPIGIGNHKALLCFLVDSIAITITTIVCCAEAGCGADTIGSIVVPLIVIGLVAAWPYLLIIRYIPCDATYKAVICMIWTGICTFLCDSFVEMALQKTSFRFPKIDLTLWNEEFVDGNIKLTVFFALLILSIILVIIKNIKVTEK